LNNSVSQWQPPKETYLHIMGMRAELRRRDGASFPTNTASLCAWNKMVANVTAAVDAARPPSRNLVLKTIACAALRIIWSPTKFTFLAPDRHKKNELAHASQL
jgi:hypothetical protein